MAKIIDAAIGKIEMANSLDRPGYVLGKAISRTGQVVGQPGKQLANGLHGRPYGHPVHPIAVTIPIGTWTLALGLDLLAATGLLRERSAARAADLALKAGAAGAAMAIATGLADWQHLNGRDRRVGLVHGMVNTTSLGLNVASIVLRGRGRLSAGRWASGVAMLSWALAATWADISFTGAGRLWTMRIAVPSRGISSPSCPSQSYATTYLTASPSGTRSRDKRSASYS